MSCYEGEMSETMDAKDKKDRKNVNVSLRKRDKELLNSILNAWYDEGYNISNEVCDAIILKNLSNTNPHIQTILSTLSLIESSLKSHFATKGLKEEVINQKALEIFNEVITIDIDGNKLTNLIKGVGIDVNNINVNNKVYDKKEDEHIQIENEKNTENKEAQQKTDKELSITSNENIENARTFKEDEKRIEQDMKKNKEVEYTKEVKENTEEIEEIEEDIFSAYAMPSGFSN